MIKRFFTALTAAVFVLALAGTSFASVDNVYEVAIINLKGDVQVDTNGDGRWVKPWIGMKLMEEASIKTGDDSLVDMVFDAEGLNVARVRANSLTTVKKALLDLPDGSVLAKFANLEPGSSFTVKTPAAACAIRGSAMLVETSGGSTRTASFQGNVYVQGFDADGNPVGSEETVPEGEQAGIDPDGNVGDTGEMDDSDRDAFDDFQGDTDGGTSDTGEGGLDDTDGGTDTKDIDEVRTVDKDDQSQISPSGSENGYENGE
jgi:hypothetical protein